MRKTLAEISGVGRASLCGGCDKVHFTFGRVTLDLTREELAELRDLVDQSAGSLGGKPLVH